MDRWRAVRELPPQGEARTLQHAQCARTFNGRLFEVRKGQWRFQEEGTGICATVQMPADGVPNRSYFAQRNLALIREMIAEHDKARRAARGRARAAARVAEVPTTACDMDVRGTTVKGKMIYSWGDTSTGRIEVEVTPRAHRAPLPDGASAHQRAADRESTPQRALRKMATKVRRLRTKAARGEHERLVARAAAEPKENALGITESDEHPAIRSLRAGLDKPSSLSAATASIAFLGSMR